jgi:hypothetical protein
MKRKKLIGGLILLSLMVVGVRIVFGGSGQKELPCRTEKDHSEFLADCSAYLRYQDLTASKAGDPDKYRTICKCVWDNFSVPSAPDCTWPPEAMRASFQTAAVDNTCR